MPLRVAPGNARGHVVHSQDEHNTLPGRLLTTLRSLISYPHSAQGGFGITVNLAARIAAHASAGQVLVSERVAERAPPQGVTFVELGQVQLEGIAQPVRLLEALRS
jgi:adenylate cyclase